MQDSSTALSPVLQFRQDLQGKLRARLNGARRGRRSARSGVRRTRSGISIANFADGRRPRRRPAPKTPHSPCSSASSRSGRLSSVSSMAHQDLAAFLMPEQWCQAA